MRGTGVAEHRVEEQRGRPAHKSGRSGGEARTGAALEIWVKPHGAGASAGLAGELKRQDREAGMKIFRSRQHSAP